MFPLKNLAHKELRILLNISESDIGSVEIKSPLGVRIFADTVITIFGSCMYIWEWYFLKG